MSSAINLDLAHEASRARTLITAGSRNLLPALAAAFLAVLLVLAVFGPALAPSPPDAQELGGRLVPPIWSDGGSTAHLLGTDELGRDVLSRLIAGVRITLVIAFGVVMLELMIGGTVGVLAGYLGGRFEAIAMRVLDIQMGFPVALVYIFIILIFGQALHVVMLALALVGWFVFGGISRVAVKRVRRAPFVEAATISGSPPARTIRRHILPQVRGELVTLYLLEVGRVLLAEATLSFLGLGIQPPHITWGLMIGGSQSLLTIAPWLAILPGLMIVLTVVSLNLVAGWVEGLTDARQRRQ